MLWWSLEDGSEPKNICKTFSVRISHRFCCCAHGHAKSIQGVFGGYTRPPTNRGSQKLALQEDMDSTSMIMAERVELPRWWFQIFSIFTPYLGKIPILTNIFQMG